MRVLFTVFSASGNTARVCGLFAERLQERGAECVTLKIRKDAETPDVAAFDTLVIGYPVHGFNAPQNVLDFAKGLPQTDEKGYYIVKTSGEPLHVNDASSRKLRKILARKGYDYRGEFHYVMPYNMIFRHSDKMAALMWQAAKNTAPADADIVFEGAKSRSTPTSLPRRRGLSSRWSTWVCRSSAEASGRMRASASLAGSARGYAPSSTSS